MKQKDRNTLKQKAVRAAIEWLTTKFDFDEGLSAGVGSGSTVGFCFDNLKNYPNILTVPTSEKTRSELEARNVRMTELDSVERLAFDIDGADEVASNFHLIKGGSGHHNEEKRVSKKSELFVVVVDSSKLVRCLGQTKPVPVEISSENRGRIEKELSRFGEVKIRTDDGHFDRTDSGNLIVDLRLKEELCSPEESVKLEEEINDVAGVIENGIFARRPADIVFVGREKGVEILRRKEVGKL